MFKLFGKIKHQQEPEIAAGIATVDEKTIYSPDIEKIHNEFFTASDRALAAANEILAKEADKFFDKGKRLLSLGFKQAQEAITVAIKESEIKIAKETADLILLYRERYPLHKFVTTEQIIEICKKYSLVYGEVSRYKGFVPEVKLQQIESFKPHQADKSTLIGVRNSKSSSNQPDYIYMEDAEVRRDGKYLHIHKINGGQYEYAFQSNIAENDGFYASDSKNIFGLAHLGSIRFNLIEGLMICAPMKDMDLKGTLIRDHQVIKVVQDPVVFYPVKGGGIALAAWGPEASDPRVVNEIYN